MKAIRGLILFLWVAGGVLPCLWSAAAESSSQLSTTFDELVALTAKGNWGVGEWARGSMLGVKLTSYGPPGVPYMRGRFLAATAPNEAFLSGAYVAIHGQNVDHRRMRADLESNPTKQTLLRRMVGDANALNASLRDGEEWRKAAEYIPALGGCRGFTLLCLQSKDPLVRRAGLYWGYWIADAEFWKRVRVASKDDPDPLTRRFAQHLEKT